MTSNSSLSVKYMTLQKDMMRRRVGAILFTAFALLMVQPVMMALDLMSLTGSLTMTEMAPAIRVWQITTRAINWTNNAVLWMFVLAFFAVYLAVRSFSYVFHKTQTDFYDSLPIPRRQRFVLLYTNGFAIFFFAYLVSTMLALLIAASFGAMMSAVVAMTAVAFIRNVLFFLAVYSCTVMCVMLAGNTIYSLLLTAFLFIAPALTLLMVYANMEMYLCTFVGRAFKYRLPLHPFYHMSMIYGGGAQAEELFVDYGWRPDNFALLCAQWIPHLLALFICFVVTLIIACVLYMRRKAEWAEGTICHRAVHHATKWITAIVGAFTIHYLIRSMFFYGRGSRDLRNDLFTVFVLLASVLVIAFVMEAMYNRSVRRGFKGWKHILAIGIVTLVLFSLFRFDMTGYDRFMPDVARVNTYAIMLDDYYPMSMQTQMYLTDDEKDGVLYAEDYIKRYMELDDVEAVTQLMETSNSILRGRSEEIERYIMGEALFRMKGGREIWRRIAIPVSTNDELLERVFGTEAYLKGVSQVYHDDAIIMKESRTSELSFVSDTQVTIGEGRLYGDFAEAYKNDLEHYSVGRAKKEGGIGYVRFTDPYVFGRYYSELTFPVYADDKATIAFLKKEGLYDETLKPYEGSKKLQPLSLSVEVLGIYEYVEEQNLPAAVAEEAMYYGDYSGAFEPQMVPTAPNASYYDTEETKQREIIESSVCHELLSTWYDYGNTDPRYRIRVTVTGAGYTEYESSWGDERIEMPVDRLFYKGKVPAYVKSDLEAADDE